MIIKKKYKVFVSLYEESNSSWVWLSEEKGLITRDLIEVKVPKRGGYCICTYREIEGNFIDYYNNSSRKCLKIDKPSIVVNDYYRKKLNIDKNEEYEFTIQKIENKQIWKRISSIRKYHPDNSLKLAVYLAICSILLGMFSIILGIINIIPCISDFLIKLF